MQYRKHLGLEEPTCITIT